MNGLTWTLAGFGVWFLAAFPIGIATGRYLRRLGDRYSPPSELDIERRSGPPEYEPDDSEAQQIAEQYADAAAEMDTWHDRPA